MKISILVYGVKILVHTENISLWNMICSYYKPFLIEAGSDSHYDIKISLERKSYFSSLMIKDAVKKGEVHIWSDIKINDEKTQYAFWDREISGTIDFSDTNTINVKAQLIPNKLRHIVHIILQWYTRIDKYYNRFIIKSCIHDMLFIALEKKLSTSLLHATAVTNGVNTYVFTGLWGSWKSTMASAFALQEGYTILSDNYAFVSKDYIYPFPELPRVTKWTQKLLGIDLHQKADGTKNYFNNDTSHLEEKYKIDGIFICSYWKDRKMEKIKDANYIFELLYSINNYTKEFPEYLNLALLSFLWKFNTNKKRIENLNAIVENNNFYILRSNSDLQEVINEIKNV